MNYGREGNAGGSDLAPTDLTRHPADLYLTRSNSPFLHLKKQGDLRMNIPRTILNAKCLSGLATTGGTHHLPGATDRVEYLVWAHGFADRDGQPAYRTDRSPCSDFLDINAHLLRE